jgi:hypothetical protein
MKKMSSIPLQGFGAIFFAFVIINHKLLEYIKFVEIIVV